MAHAIACMSCRTGHLFVVEQKEAKSQHKGFAPMYPKVKSGGSIAFRATEPFSQKYGYSQPNRAQTYPLALTQNLAHLSVVQ